VNPSLGFSRSPYWYSQAAAEANQRIVLETFDLGMQAPEIAVKIREALTNLGKSAHRFINFADSFAENFYSRDCLADGVAQALKLPLGGLQNSLFTHDRARIGCSQTICGKSRFLEGRRREERPFGSEPVDN
jgi:hypothetical protein